MSYPVISDVLVDGLAPLSVETSTYRVHSLYFDGQVLERLTYPDLISFLVFEL